MLQLGQTSCFGGLGLFYLLWLIMSGTGTLGQYNPPCHTNCSWKNAVGEIQMCMQEWLNDATVCPNLFGNDGSAPPAENIEVDSYVTTYTGYTVEFTKLNISFDLNLNGSGIYRGVSIEIQHLDRLNNEMYCHYINFTDELTYDDLLSEEDTVRRIFFDCSRPVRPGGEYLITIKTMPSTEKAAFTYYWPPSCFYKKDDYYCQISEADLPSVWSPSTYIVDSEGDRRVELIFNLAPYDFDMYLVYLNEKEIVNDKYQPVTHKHLYCFNIHVKSKNVTTERCPSQEIFQFNVISWKENNETMVKIIWTDVREAVYYVKMEPRPTAEGQQCSTNNAVSCFITTKDVIVKARPCERIPDPCEAEHMRCKEEESEPTCFCEKGFEMQNKTCVVASLYSCEEGWDSFDSSCYKFFETSKTWQDARTACLNMAADLVVVRNQEENDFLYNYSRKYQRHFWLGLTDIQKENNFIWIDSGECSNFSKSVKLCVGKGSGCVTTCGSRCFLMNFPCIIPTYVIDRNTSQQMVGMTIALGSRNTHQIDSSSALDDVSTSLTPQLNSIFHLELDNLNKIMTNIHGSNCVEQCWWNQDFASKEPNNENFKEHCIEYYPSGKWNDQYCNRTRLYLCEKYQDKMPPSHGSSCPDDMHVLLSSTTRSAAVCWIPPTWNDDSLCHPNVINSHSPGHVIEIPDGDLSAFINVTYTATDKSGNSETCYFRVTASG
ncbi:uncharacterized protein LOC117110173 [Anneissia japonica]|uniref:uncharacterized protein LOC117110173 n=1 Tax=Anneissia japonica TaxID=1529436 RepID=UPI0014259A67|nr:uncharacterized protein LOC117110173 [Anneissia japonica]